MIQRLGAHENFDHPPRVFLGMPVYNEARYIEKSITSLLNQDYNNFEILVSDNGSTDATEEICRRFAQKDTRIRYQRLDHNVGAPENFRHVLNLAEGSYFMWASGHDLWAPNYLSQCVQLLESHPNSAIAFGSCDWIDTEGSPWDRESGWTDTRGMNRIARYFSVIWGNMHPILGVIRLGYLRQARQIQTMVGSDLVLLTELALMGDFIYADQTNWKRREMRGRERYQEKLERYKSKQYGLTGSKISCFFPLAKLPLELVTAVLRAKIPLSEKIYILMLLAPALPVKYLTSRK